MPLEVTLRFDSFRNAQQVRSALILLRMSLDCSYAGCLCAEEIGFDRTTLRVIEAMRGYR